ncbi:mucin-17-like [Orycteropus afer afer]|uniref:Mucin-17-like n=1 Tax=Orycteropus afer afer TaxID=1230840 RepID=A0AC54ZAK8_ORYAF|nr:mucin-17-like [Orycteropus afer afer]
MVTDTTIQGTTPLGSTTSATTSGPTTTSEALTTVEGTTVTSVTDTTSQGTTTPESTTSATTIATRDTTVTRITHTTIQATTPLGSTTSATISGPTTTSEALTTVEGTTVTSGTDTTSHGTTTPESTASATTIATMICLNNGQWNGENCECPSGFKGDRCQYSDNCQNEGIWDGSQCKCTYLYQGPTCEQLANSINVAPPPETVTAQVELTVTIVNHNFTEDLNNKSSPTYLDFRKTFTKEMDILYAGIPEYNGVNITKLRPGSVVVEHEVLLKTNFTPEYKEELTKATQQVEEKIMIITQEQVMSNNTCPASLCFNKNATKVQNVTVTQYDPEAECKKKAGEEFAQYFFVEYKDQKANCISACMPGFNASMDCHEGKCKLQRSGPRCYCLTTDTHWYTGETCESSIRKSLVYGIIGAGGVVVLVILVALLVFVFLSKREVQRQKSKVSQLYKWHEEDGGPAPGTFQNIGFDICEEQEDSIYMDSIYSNFQASLSHIDSETKVKIQRPQAPSNRGVRAWAPLPVRGGLVLLGLAGQKSDLAS